MKMKKVWALLVSLMLVASMALPVALAVSDDQGASAAAVSSEEGTPPAEEQVEQKEADPKPDAEPEQDDQESDSQEQDGKESGENQCTCGAAEGKAHAADCPLYEKPEADKADENAALYQKFLAAKTMEEANALYNGLSKEEVTAFRTWLEENNKLTALEQHLSAITPEGEPVTMPIVSFTKVGPLLAAPARRARMMRAAAAQDNTGIVLNKSAKSLGNGNYQITLEAYATGASSTTTSTEPADIVLVLDVSGSMKEKMTQYKKVYDSELKNKNTYYIQQEEWYRPVTWNKDFWGNYYWGNYYWGDYWNSFTPKTDANDTDKDHVQFYELVESQETKLASLKNAVNGFINNVAKQSPDSQIALVKFAGNKKNKGGNDFYQEGGYTYNYTQIVKKLTDASKSTELKNAVNELQPDGATAADYGMQHAQTIINGAANDGKKKVVIMFTDGEPNHSSDFDENVATDTISASKDMKDVGATVYTIGVFSGANGRPVNSWEGVSDTNKYMHLVSSNYKDATAMDQTGTATYPEGGKSYFLSAGSADELSSIFQQISQEVGGSTSNLDASATIKDIVTPYFDMPTDPKEVKVYTAESKGNTNDWENPEVFRDGKVTLDATNNTVSVSGFSYKDNWCGSGSNGFNNGKKLIIQFNVTAKDGFLGGNDVPTNVETSGIYDKDGKEVKPFEQPTVNVPIKEVKVTAEDKNVYLLGDVTTEQLKTGATVTVKCGDKCGKVTLDLSKANNNYGLAAWQNAYVDIEAGIKDQDGKALTNGYTGLTEDTTYIVSVAVKPNDPGTTTPEKGAAATEQTGQATGKINVFTPELTFKDGNAYYGETVSMDFTANKVEDTVWKHGDTASTDKGVTMLSDTVPTLDITYTPDESTVKDNKYTKVDAAVKATVKIGDTDVTQYTTFQHQNCDPACGWQKPTTAGDPAFLIHIKTCTLNITKAGGKEDESYVFNILKDGEKYSEVTIWGNDTETLSELPVGTYTIREDTGWSWRFKADDNGKATLSAEADAGKITCTNKQKKDKWINGFSNVVRNIFEKVTTK